MNAALKDNIETQDAKLLSIPFPSWISRWANVYFLAAILSPVILLLFIKQSPYEQLSFSALKKDGQIILVSKVTDAIAQYNYVGQEVLLKVSQSGEKIYGSIAAISPDPDNSFQNIYIYADQINAAGNHNISGLASFKKKEVSILEKIFD